MDQLQTEGKTQRKFEKIYRGRQATMHHVSYMRLSKVLLALRAMRRSGCELKSRSVFDYGFGAGTFFRFCPTDSPLYGVEQDPVVCNEVAHMLASRGHRQVDLQPIEISRWNEHPLLKRDYDVFLCSHVLEHLPDPLGFLKTVRQCVKPDGIFLGLVPINERATNPHHLQVVDCAIVEGWARDSGYELAYYEENDPFLYWIQPLYAADCGWRRLLGQIVRLSSGIPSRILGERIWYGVLAKAFLLFSRPTQAVFVLRHAKAGQ